jgi:plastocyanin
VVTVEIREFKFEPETLTVHEGDTVVWKNDEIVPHTATAVSTPSVTIFFKAPFPS